MFCNCLKGRQTCCHILACVCGLRFTGVLMGPVCFPLSVCRKQLWLQITSVLYNFGISYCVMFGMVCKQFCFKPWSNYSRVLEQIIVSRGQSGSEQKESVSCVAFRRGVSLKAAVAHVHTQLGVRLTFRGRWVWCWLYVSQLFVHQIELISSMVKWLHEFQKELNLWIKGIGEILAVNNHKMSRTRLCEKILYCFVNKLCFLLHRSQKWAFTLETAIFDTPGSLFPAQLTLHCIHWSIIRGLTKPSHFLPSITALNQAGGSLWPALCTEISHQGMFLLEKLL